MAYRLRYSMQFNAREAIHLLELRSAPQGHPAYRRVVLEMHRLIAQKAGHTAVADAMTHMTFEAPALERLDSERKAENHLPPPRGTRPRRCRPYSQDPTHARGQTRSRSHPLAPRPNELHHY